MLTLPILMAAGLTLLPFLAFAFLPASTLRKFSALPLSMRIFGPAVFALPYAIVAASFGIFHWGWFALYAVLPVAIAFLLWQARQADPEQRGNWRDFLILLVLGLAVDLRWFEPAWPHGLSVFGKILLLDAGIYAFQIVRQLDGVGFALGLRLRDIGVGLREFLLFAPTAIALGLSLGFLHWHTGWPSLLQVAQATLFTFLFVATPEELFFRGWMQNLLERLLGRRAALLLTAAIFGVSHWNKRTTGFNWQYVLLAALAGVFYGRAWRQERRVGASALTHTLVDTVWSLWLR